MAVARALAERADAGEVAGAEAGPYRAVAAAMEIIPRTLAANCGAKVIRVLSELRAQHAASDKRCHGVNGNSGQVEDMKAAGVWEPYVVKTQTLKTAIEAATLLLRIDDIVSGLKKRDRGAAGPQQPQADAGENVDSEMMLPE
ncbi:hypothetical protein H632_c1255p0 [Helicosporidium sp. ATCC 50920]|nr:hypothetical protein H632_c1255p0 [Helicosporidium sp. ATCC 50920]|eukprot:KDD74523.1 hypothetical protein H632_c1255p0 [Helicosporidium sp. ATCC 50920]